MDIIIKIRNADYKLQNIIEEIMERELIVPGLIFDSCIKSANITNDSRYVELTYDSKDA